MWTFLFCRGGKYKVFSYIHIIQILIVRKLSNKIKTMKITHLFWSLTFGGIETMLVNIVNSQVEQGEDVSLILINSNSETSLLESIDKRVDVRIIGRRRGGILLWPIIKLNMLLHQINPDVIHLHRCDLYGLIFNRKLSRVACVTLHALPIGSVRRESIIGYVWRKLRHKSQPVSNVGRIHRIPTVFAISNAVQKELSDRYGVTSTVVNNGILSSLFKQRNDVMPANPLRIVMVSRLEHDKKGQDLLIEAVASLSGKAIVDFIGAGNSLDYLKSLAIRLGADSYIRFLGKQTQEYIAKNLSNYDLFVQPSRWEGFGLTVAEAMSACVPVLVSKGQGPAEVTCGDKYGWTFNNGDVKDLAEKIALIADHYAEAMQKAKSARNYVMSTYDVSVTARRYIEEYSKMNIHM